MAGEVDALSLVWNGVDSDTGGYAFTPRSITEIDARVRTTPAPGSEHRSRIDRRAAVVNGLAAPPFTNLERLEETGWGIVFPDGIGEGIEEALAPLVARRKKDAGGLFKRLTYHAGQTIAQLRAIWGYSPAIVYPDQVPAYLMLVGGPDLIPFAIEYALGADFMVGRIAFDRSEDYARYAAALLAAEQTATRPPKLAFFAPKNADDRATLLSHDNLVEPLFASTVAPGFAKEAFLASDATRDRLLRLLGAEAPAILFAASHGLCCRSNNPDQRELQGAIITQEWPGPMAERVPRAEWSVPGGALDNQDLTGLVALLFACFGGGTPARAEYSPVFADDGTRLAAAPFVARLPQALLVRGASAVIAHVERTWDTGFRWPGVHEPQYATMRSVLEALARGLRVGHAKWALSLRYTSLCADLDREERLERDDMVPLPPMRRAFLFTATSDARAWVVLGDPAARAVSCR